MFALAAQDPEVARAIAAERRRLVDEIVLIASENYASTAVMEATGSVMTNKYAEGYPGRRYYAGCENVDIVERLAIERAKQLFGAEHANVQPHSGSQANMAAYFALLKPGDRIMGMRLDQGGHLTHGAKINFSGKIYEFSHYGVDPETEMIDYGDVARIAREFKPDLIVAGATAYPRTIDFPRFRQIADEVGARLMVDMAHIAGLIAGGAHPSPVPYADIVTTTTHKTLRGPRGAMALCRTEHARKLDNAVFPNMQGGPMEHVIAAKAVAFGEAQKPEFAAYARAVVSNASALAAALAAGGLRIVSGGTDNHLMLVDVRPLKMTGKQAEEALVAAGIVVNKNSIPNDPEPPMVTSGIRLGTPAITTRGMAASDMETVAGFILEGLRAAGDAGRLGIVKGRVRNFASAFPAPGVTS
ncbi:MAG: serine hydroxymethyltransferase [Dehalococcoidia bacterium]|nr:serine hydroxymethyltransferase [Dehalococcoidia bacterium]